MRVAFVLLGVVFTGCKVQAPPPVAVQTPSRVETVEGVRFLEQFPHGGSEDSVLLVAIHGRGDTAEQFAGLFAGFPARVELALPEAALPFGDGFSFFDWPPGTGDDALTAVLSEAEERLWKAIHQLAHGRPVLVTGFSQGGMLSWVLAARHPEQVRAAFPVSGFAPAKLFPSSGAKTAPVHALHGDADRMIDIERARATLAGFQQAGAPAELREFPGVGHTVTRPMRERLFADLSAAVLALDAGAGR
jgi:phospholipase/carboxylesterase